MEAKGEVMNDVSRDRSLHEICVSVGGGEGGGGVTGTVMAVTWCCACWSLWSTDTHVLQYSFVAVGIFLPTYNVERPHAQEIG
jgi:hypothetical protein